MRWIYLSILLVVIYACNSKQEQVQISFATETPSITGLPEMLIPLDNPSTEKGIQLGRMLFYDPILSLDSTQSCASCHRQELAFSDGRSKSIGVLGEEGTRSSMSLVNIGYTSKGLFWDGRSPSLEEQSLHPVRDQKELANHWTEVERRLQEHPTYAPTFREVFDLKEIKQLDSTLVAKALAQFERSIVGFDSKYDQVQRGETDFTVSELRGWTIFFDASLEVPHAECNHCHGDPLFSNLEFHNNGLQKAPNLNEFNDLGKGAISKVRFDNGKFRVPTLRNIALTAPYMHDGSMQSLEEVLDHYISGGHYAINVSANVRKLQLDEKDKADLIAFLHTLTDTAVVNNPALSNPF